MVVVVSHDPFVLEPPSSFVVFKNLIESFWFHISLVIRVFDPEEEVEVIGLDSMFIESLGDDSHHFSKTIDLLDQGHFAAQIHHATNRHWLQEEDLVDAKQLSETVRVLQASSNECIVESFLH